jgi:threonine/homoserine efflux transporter RhtA
MNAPQAAGIPLIAFGLTEFFMRRGATARSLKPTASDKGTTPLIFACYALVVCLLFVPNVPGAVLPAAMAWTGVGVAFAGLDWARNISITGEGRGGCCHSYTRRVWPTCVFHQRW